MPDAGASVSECAGRCLLPGSLARRFIDDAHHSVDVALAMGTSVQSVAPLRDGLIRKGMIYSPAHGETDFTVPLFDQFLHRVMRASSSS